MRALWFNADDFGHSPGVSDGIVEAMTRGCVGTTTAMVARDGTLDAIARHAPQLAGRIGVHLQLTGGRPLLPADEVPSLVGPDGSFPRHAAAVRHPDRREVEREWAAQIAAVRDVGVEPSHIDSHHHVHALPMVTDAFVATAQRHDLPARGFDPSVRDRLREAGVRTADVFSGDFYGEHATLDGLLDALRRAASTMTDTGTLEVMCHPGRVDDALRATSSYVDERAHELELLCDPDLPARIHDLGFEIVTGPCGS